MNKFKEKYKLLDNQRLLKIIADAENYESDAIEAAKKEIVKRQISQEEIDFIKEEIKEKKLKSEALQEKVKTVEEKAKAAGTEFLNTINPIQKEAQTTDRKINLIVIGLVILSSYQVFDAIGMLRNWFAYHFGIGSVFDVLFYVYFAVLILVTSILFWKRKKVGWVLLDIQLVYHTILYATIFSINVNKQKEPEEEGLLGLIDNLANIEPYSYQANPLSFLVLGAILGVVLWLINKTDIRARFNIERKEALMVFGFTVSFALIYLVQKIIG